MSDDSFMEIVRERLAGHRFMEAQGKDGLFFNRSIVAGETFYVDMRKDPMKMYGYKILEADKDVALEQSYVDNVLQDVRADLVSIGCSLSDHGVEELPEKPKKTKPDTVETNTVTLELEALEQLIKSAKETFQDHLTLGEYTALLVTKQGDIELKIPRPEIKKSDQRTIDKGFF